MLTFIVVGDAAVFDAANRRRSRDRRSCDLPPRTAPEPATSASWSTASSRSRRRGCRSKPSRVCAKSGIDLRTMVGWCAPGGGGSLFIDRMVRGASTSAGADRLRPRARRRQDAGLLLSIVARDLRPDAVVRGRAGRWCGQGVRPRRARLHRDRRGGRAACGREAAPGAARELTAGTRRSSAVAQRAAPRVQRCEHRRQPRAFRGQRVASSARAPRRGPASRISARRCSGPTARRRCTGSGAGTSVASFPLSRSIHVPAGHGHETLRPSVRATLRPPRSSSALRYENRSDGLSAGYEIQPVQCCRASAGRRIRMDTTPPHRRSAPFAPERSSTAGCRRRGPAAARCSFARWRPICPLAQMHPLGSFLLSRRFVAARARVVIDRDSCCAAATSGVSTSPHSVTPRRSTRRRSGDVRDRRPAWSGRGAVAARSTSWTPDPTHCGARSPGSTTSVSWSCSCCAAGTTSSRSSRTAHASRTRPGR